MKGGGRIKKYVKGSANFYSFKNDKTLDCITVTDVRVGPEDRLVQLPASQMSGPLFTVCQNYFNKPPQMKGAAIAFKTNKKNKYWKFGIIHRQLNDGDFSEILVWNGPSLKLLNNKMYPAFYVMDQAFLELKSKVSNLPKFEFIWQFHFTCLTIGLGKITDLRYLNQVDGILPKSMKFNFIVPRVNLYDGCFKQLTLGPDIFYCPQNAKEYFPKYLLPTEELIPKSNSYLNLPQHFPPKKIVMAEIKTNTKLHIFYKIRSPQVFHMWSQIQSLSKIHLVKITYQQLTKTVFMLL